MPFHKPHRVDFHDLPRRIRNKAYIQVKNLIRQHRHELGGRFYTHQSMTEPTGWVDVYFLGSKSPLFYNATLETITEAYKELVWETAFEASYELAPDNPFDWFTGMTRDPKTGFYIAPSREPERFPELDGLTRHEWMKRKLPEIADSGSVQVTPGWKFDPHYHSGVGLTAVLDVPTITRDVIHEFIDNFLRSPTHYQDDSPRTFRYADVQDWV